MDIFTYSITIEESATYAYVYHSKKKRKKTKKKSTKNVDTSSDIRLTVDFQGDSLEIAPKCSTEYVMGSSDAYTMTTAGNTSIAYTPIPPKKGFKVSSKAKKEDTSLPIPSVAYTTSTVSGTEKKSGTESSVKKEANPTHSLSEGLSSYYSELEASSCQDAESKKKTPSKEWYTSSVTESPIEQSDVSATLSLEEAYDMFSQHQNMVSKVLDGIYFDQRTLDKDDLKQWGLEGLWKATQSFDKNFGSTFCSFAISCIRTEVIDNIRKHGRTIYLPYSQVQKMKDDQEQVEGESFKTFHHDYDMIGSDGLDSYQHSEALEDALSSLDQRSRDILYKKWVLEVSTDNLALEYDISSARVNQIIRNSLSNISQSEIDRIKEQYYLRL